MISRFLTIAVMILGIVFVMGLTILSGQQDMLSLASGENQKNITQMQTKIDDLVKLVEKQEQTYQALQQKVAKINSSVIGQSLSNETMTPVKDQKVKHSKNTYQANQPDADMLRSMILEVFQETLTQEQQAQQKQQAEQNEFNSKRVAEQDSVRQYVVDQMGQKLGLTNNQKEVFGQMMDEYSDLRNESNQQIVRDFEASNVDSEQIQQYFAEKLDQDSEINIQLEDEFVALLDNRQAQIYRQLPDNEKAFIGHRLLLDSDVSN